MKKIRALFIGTDGSMGFRKDRLYILMINPKSPNRVETEDGKLSCEYGSLIKFFQNWEVK